MNQRKLIVVTLEGLATSALSCYGSSWNVTPTIDSLASVGTVWDQCIAASDDPLVTIQSWLTGDNESHLRCWAEQGRVELICDDPRLIETGADSGFDQTFLVDSLQTLDYPAEQIESTAFGELVATAIDRGSRPDPWSLLWLHSRFLTEYWDAPRGLSESDFSQQATAGGEEFTEVDAEETIPSVFTQTTPPAIAIDQSTHPDLITSWMTTYGCQVQLIDDLIEVMVLALEASDATIIVAGSSGFSLGQNGWIGHRVGPLRSCHARLPLIVGRDGPLHWPGITSVNVLPSLIGQLADGSLSTINPESWIAQDQPFEPRLVTEGKGQTAVTTPHWFFVCQKDGEQQLFLKPDDVEDFNDVSRLRTDVVNQLAGDVFG